MNRLEEVNPKKIDAHLRFSGKNSIAFKNGYLNRPIVDELFEIVETAIKILWPSKKLTLKKYQIFLSHDVDRIERYNSKNIFKFLRLLGGDIFKRNEYKYFLLAPYLYLTLNKKKINQLDPYNYFDWLMNISEKKNIKSLFNFVVSNNSYFDPDYSLDDFKVIKLLKNISSRGHKIGLHLSYDSYNNKQQIEYQFQKLKKTLKKENITQNLIYSRTHYLRWVHPETLLFQDFAGINIDTSMGYSDCAGFRCGTSHSYPGYDIVNNKIMKIRISPLIIMDCTLFEKESLNLNTEEALNYAKDLMNKCKKYNGVFNILWHNSYELDKKKVQDFYTKIIDE